MNSAQKRVEVFLVQRCQGNNYGVTVAKESSYEVAARKTDELQNLLTEAQRQADENYQVLRQEPQSTRHNQEGPGRRNNYRRFRRSLSSNPRSLQGVEEWTGTREPESSEGLDSITYPDYGDVHDQVEIE